MVVKEQVAWMCTLCIFVCAQRYDIRKNTIQFIIIIIILKLGSDNCFGWLYPKLNYEDHSENKLIAVTYAYLISPRSVGPPGEVCIYWTSRGSVHTLDPQGMPNND